MFEVTDVEPFSQFSVLLMLFKFEVLPQYPLGATGRTDVCFADPEAGRAALAPYGYLNMKLLMHNPTTYIIPAPCSKCVPEPITHGELIAQKPYGSWIQLLFYSFVLAELWFRTDPLHGQTV